MIVRGPGELIVLLNEASKGIGVGRIKSGSLNLNSFNYNTDKSWDTTR